jgi:hypothetical protein
VSYIETDRQDVVKSNMTSYDTYFQVMLRYLYFTTHGSFLTSILAVWVWLPLPVEHLVVFTFSENTKIFY